MNLEHKLEKLEEAEQNHKRSLEKSEKEFEKINNELEQMKDNLLSQLEESEGYLNVEIDELVTDRELHNKKIKLLTFKIVDEIEGVYLYLNKTNSNNPLLDSYLYDVLTLADIIVDLTQKEIKKSQC